MKGATSYYNIKNMDCPTPELYGISEGCKVLMVGTARPQTWALTIDNDPASPADMICDGRRTPFRDKVFDIVILDYTTNFMPPKYVPDIIAEANRIGKRVMGRCHISTDGKTLRGPKQAYCHMKPPQGVEWVQILSHNMEDRP